MDLKKLMSCEGEKPLDNIVENGGYCGIFRKIACIGDSLSSGEFESFLLGEPGWHDYYDYSWGQYIARDAGCTVYNLSRGGMTAKEYMQSFAREKGFFDEEYKSQAYIIALGVNDVTEILKKEEELGSIDTDAEFGSVNDVNTEDWGKNKPSFAGYYGALISKYKEIQPKAKFFLMTMPKDGSDEKRSALYDRHAELMYDFAKLFDNCYVLDFRKYAPEYNEDFKKKFFLSGHLNAAGYRLTALMTESYIDYIIRNDFEAFSQIGFVGTPFHNSNYKW